MDEQKIKKIKSIVSSLAVSHTELLSTYQEGYIRKKVYQVTKLGEEILELENQRLKKFISLYEKGEG